MADRKRVLLHIGAPKTGTTYLQRVMDANRETLAEHGVLYPKIRGDAHHSAVWDLRGKFEGSASATRFDGHWEQLLREARDWTGHTVVVSSEHFVFAEPKNARRIVESFDDAEVHVVYTARDLGRQVPAVWQEQVKNRRTMRYGRYLDDVLGKRRTKLAKHFWKAQDAVVALRRWSQGLPPDRVHVVTAPPPGAPPATLWRRFAEVCGIDPDAYDAEIPIANESLGIAAAEMLRRFNERHGRMNILTYRSKVLRPLLTAMSGGVNDRSKLPLTSAQRDRIGRLSEEIVADLRRGGYAVTGDLDDLLPPRDRAAERDPVPGPDDLDDADMVGVLVDVVHALLGSPEGEPEPDASDDAPQEPSSSARLTAPLEAPNTGPLKRLRRERLRRKRT